jgi:hypothetical protein
MPQEPEPFNYTGEHEMFALGAKVNRLCGLTADTFNPDTHVTELKEVIKAISSRMKASAKFSFHGWRN